MQEEKGDITSDLSKKDDYIFLRAIGYWAKDNQTYGLFAINQGSNCGRS